MTISTRSLATMTHTTALLFLMLLAACGSSGTGTPTLLNSQALTPLTASGLAVSPLQPLVAEPVTFSANCAGGSGSIAYAWSFGDGTTSTQPVPKHSFATARQYTIALVCTDQLGGTARTSTQIMVSVDIPPVVRISFSPGGISQTGTVLSLAAVASSAIGDTLTYIWNFGDASPSSGGVDLSSITHEYATPGTYTVTLAVIDQHGGSTVATVTVGSGIPAYTQVPTSQTTRNNKAIPFTAVAIEPGQAIVYSWNFGDGSAPVIGQSPTHTYPANSPANRPYTVTVIAADGHGGKAYATASVTVVDDRPPTTPIIVAPTHIDIHQQPTGFSVVTASAFGDSLTYRWDFGDGTTSTSGSPQHAYASDGQYTVAVTVTDSVGMSSSNSLTVAVGSFSSGLACTGPTAGKGWCVQNPLPTPASLSGIAMVNSQVGWAVGERSTILKTIDGGISWTQQFSPVATYLAGVAAVDSQNAWVVGSSGLILKTTDGGENWYQEPSGTTYQLNSISAVNGNALWAVGEGGTILQSTDGGVTWQPEASNGFASLTSVSAADATHVWTVGSTGLGQNVILATSDGGASWSAQTINLTATSVIYSVKVVDANTAWVVGSDFTIGVAFKTIDGGASWQDQSANFPTQLQSVTAIDTNTAWAGGGSSLYYTVDGGATWAAATVTGSIFCSCASAMSAADAQHVWSAGAFGALHGSITGGVTWQSLNRGTQQNLNAVGNVPGSTSEAWASGYNGTLIHTTDAGEIWTAQTSGTLNAIVALSVVNSSTVWASAQFTLLRTVDGGQNWIDVTPPVASGTEFTSVAGVDQNTAWVVTAQGTIFETPDGGMTWNTQLSGTTPLTVVSALDASHAWVGGDSGTILKTADGGATWLPQSISTTQTVTSIAVQDANTLWVSSQGLSGLYISLGAVFRSVDGGTTWTNPYSSTSAGIESVSVASPTGIWAVDKDGSVLQSNDGGNTWSQTFNSFSTWSPAGADLHYRSAGLVAADSVSGWSVAGVGLIVHTDTGGT